jgi:ABC-type microcin C transport system permease subunit YejB
MRIFEIYPPSSVLVSGVVAVGMAIGGLQFVVLLLAGAGVMALGHWLDWYGIRR